MAIPIEAIRPGMLSYSVSSEMLPSPQRSLEQRFNTIKRRLHYFGNGVDLDRYDPRSDGLRLEDVIFHALSQDNENKWVVGSGLLDTWYRIPRFVSAGLSDFLIFDTSDEIWKAIASVEGKSGRNLQIAETIGKHSSFLHRARQKQTELLFLLQNVVPGRHDNPPKDVEIPPNKDVALLIIGTTPESDIPEEELVDPRSRFKEVRYQFFPFQRSTHAA